MEKGPEKLSFQRHKLMSSLMSSEFIWEKFYVMHLEINVAVPELFLPFISSLPVMRNAWQTDVILTTVNILLPRRCC